MASKIKSKCPGTKINHETMYYAMRGFCDVAVCKSIRAHLPVVNSSVRLHMWLCRHASRVVAMPPTLVKLTRLHDFWDYQVFKIRPSNCQGLQNARPCGTMENIPWIQSPSLDHVDIIPHNRGCSQRYIQ